jgi:fermentation-respiration switch protein FrsA (DUF1100 family)
VADEILNASLPPAKRTVTQKGWRFFVFLMRTLLVLLIMLAWFQRSLIYLPTKAKDLAASESGVTQPVVDLQITTQDDLVLNGWLALVAEPSKPQFDLASLESRSNPLVIVFPGNGGHRAMRGYLLESLRDCGADVMIFDHRGYGDNEGSPTEAHLVRDARSIWNYATKDLKVPPGRIVIYGESLGGGVAVRLASDLCSDGIEPGGLVVQSSFNSLVSAGRYHFPILPVSLLLIDRFESQQHIQQVTCPYLHLHGRRDRVVPVELGQKLFEAAPEKSSGGVNKQLVLLPNTDHNDVYGPDRHLVMHAVTGFLADVKQRSNPEQKPLKGK